MLNKNIDRSFVNYFPKKNVYPINIISSINDVASMDLLDNDKKLTSSKDISITDKDLYKASMMACKTTLNLITETYWKQPSSRSLDTTNTNLYYYLATVSAKVIDNIVMLNNNITYDFVSTFNTSITVVNNSNLQGSIIFVPTVIYVSSGEILTEKFNTSLFVITGKDENIVLSGIETKNIINKISDELKAKLLQSDWKNIRPIYNLYIYTTSNDITVATQINTKTIGVSDTNIGNAVLVTSSNVLTEPFSIIESYNFIGDRLIYNENIESSLRKNILRTNQGLKSQNGLYEFVLETFGRTVLYKIENNMRSIQRIFYGGYYDDSGAGINGDYYITLAYNGHIDLFLNGIFFYPIRHGFYAGDVSGYYFKGNYRVCEFIYQNNGDMIFYSVYDNQTWTV